MQSKAKQRCVMGVGMCLYAQLVQTKNKQCKSAIIIQCYHPYLSDFCSRLTQPCNHIIYPGVAKIYLFITVGPRVKCGIQQVWNSCGTAGTVRVGVRVRSCSASVLRILPVPAH